MLIRHYELHTQVWQNRKAQFSALICPCDMVLPARMVTVHSEWQRLVEHNGCRVCYCTSQSTTRKAAVMRNSRFASLREQQVSVFRRYFPPLWSES